MPGWTSGKGGKVMQVLKKGTRPAFAPMVDVTQYWNKPNKLLNPSHAKVKRMFVFGFGHMNEDKLHASVGRSVLATLPERFPDRYPPWKPCQVGTYDCQVSHGARITLLLSPPTIRSQHLGPWCIKSMRGVIQGYIDGKRRQIPGTVQDLFGDIDGSDGTPLAPLDTTLDLSEGEHMMGANYEDGIQVGLLSAREVAAVVIHDDNMLEPGVVAVPPWQPGMHGGFNGVVTSFRKGFMTGVRGARITIGCGWPGYEKAMPRPAKPELIPKLFHITHKYPPGIIERVSEAVEDNLRLLQQRWQIDTKVRLRNKWQEMSEGNGLPAEKEAERQEKLALLEKELCSESAEIVEKLTTLRAEWATTRKAFMNESEKMLNKLQRDCSADPDEYELKRREWRRSRRATYRLERKAAEAKIRKAERRALKIAKQLRAMEDPKERTPANTPDRLLGQREGRRNKIIELKKQRMAAAQAAEDAVALGRSDNFVDQMDKLTLGGDDDGDEESEESYSRGHDNDDDEDDQADAEFERYTRKWKDSGAQTKASMVKGTRWQ